MEQTSTRSREDAVSQELLEASANALLQAYTTKLPVEPPRNNIAGMSLDDAYAIQNLQLQRQLGEGRILAGRKIGLTSHAMQKQLGVDSPDFGYFFEDMVHRGDATISMSAGQFISPKVEPEFGFVLKSPLQGPGVTLEQAIDAIGEVYPAIEIIDSRIANWDITLVDTVADNASCGAIAVSTTPLNISAHQLAGVECSLLIDGHVTHSGIGTDVLGHPVAPLTWLANVLGARGVALEAGQLVLPGSFTKAMPVVADSSATADFGSLGALTINFTE